MENPNKKGINILSVLIGIIAFLFTMDVSFGWVEYYLQFPLSFVPKTNTIIHAATPVITDLAISAGVAAITIYLVESLIKTIA